MRCMIKKMYRAGVILAMSLILVGTNQREVKAAEPYESFTKTEEWEVLKETNKNRNSGGKEGLSTFSSIQKASHVRAGEIVDYFSHTRPDGTSCFTVLKSKKIKYYSAGENIAAGQGSPQAVLNSWMNSPGHKANIMNGNFSHLGAGYKEAPGTMYRKYWVQLFVGGCKTTNIEMDTTAVKSYTKGTTIDEMNRYLVVTCDLHGVSYMPVSDKMCKGYNRNKNGKQTITVKYHDLKTTFDVKVGSDSEDTEEKKTVKKPGKVTGLTVKSITAKKAKLTWKKKSSDGYEIYMKTGNGKYKKIKTIKSAKTTSYTVKNLKKGKKYTFKVRAYRLDGTKKVYGKFSAAKKIS